MSSGSMQMESLFYLTSHRTEMGYYGQDMLLHILMVKRNDPHDPK